MRYYRARDVKDKLKETITAVNDENLFRCEMLDELICPNPHVMFNHGKCCMNPPKCPRTPSRDCEQIVKIKDNRPKAVSLLILREPVKTFL